MTRRLNRIGCEVFPTFHHVGLAEPRHGSDAHTVVERPFHRDLAVGVSLSRALWRQLAFRQHAHQVRSAPDARATAWQLALSYGRGDRRRGLIANLLLTAAAVPPRWSPRMLELIWLRPIIGREEPPKGGAYRVSGKTMDDAFRGTELIARRGAGLCIVPGCTAARGSGFYVRRGESCELPDAAYCDEHREDDSRYADEKTIERTFTAAIKAWPSSAERELLLWYWQQRG